MIDAIHSIALEPVTSTALAAIGYDPSARELHVQLHSGHIVSYRDFPLSGWEAFHAAPSKGAHWNAEIKKRFTGRKVTGTCQCGDVGLLEQTCTCCGCASYQPNEKAR